MLNKCSLNVRGLFFSSILLLSFGLAYADDPGITKVRLIQQTDTSYLFEADVPQLVLSSIKKPILPERFSYSEFKLINQSGWITLQTVISTSGKPFEKDDEILLPWLRNGVDFTAQWKDGETFKGLFTRTLKGIHIPLAEVMPTQKSLKTVLMEGFSMGIGHLKFKSIHVILIFCIMWAFPGAKGFQYLLWWSLGQALSMIFAEFNFPATDLLYSDLLITSIILILAYTLAYKKDVRLLWMMLLVTGFMHGLSFVYEITDDGFTRLQRIQALFAFNLAIDIGQYFTAGILISLIPKIKRFVSDQKFSISAGAIAVLLFILIFSDNISVGKTNILSNRNSPTGSIKLPAPTKISTQQVQRGAGMMTSPIMAYLSVEPYEIRQEVLVKAASIINMIDPNFNQDFIPVEAQEKIWEILIERISSENSIKVGNQVINHVESSANFVQLSKGGVSIRETAKLEEVEDAIIGITYIYDITSFPESIEYSWRFFPHLVNLVEASIVDPYGSITKKLSVNEHMIKWQNRISGLQMPTVEPVQKILYPLPLVSVIMLIAVLLIAVVQVLKGAGLRFKNLMICAIGVAMLSYPFLRFQSQLPYISDWKPSEERTTKIMNDLLGNVYRAFDRRKEDDVYDRLALSVTGDQLTDIYLGNRQAMALENRGGARATVDEINMLDIHEIKKAADGGFIADAAWTVRGSVNHFGHTHYRQNQYRALVAFVDDNGFWKISSIETIEEKRIY